MRKSTLIKRLRSLRTRDDCCALAVDLYGTEEKCEGTIAERFIAGWVNAMDMVDENHSDVIINGEVNDANFVRYSLSEVENCGWE